MSWRQRLAQNRLPGPGAGVIALLSVIQMALVLPESAVSNDFAHYYLSSHLLLEGKNPYTTPLEPLYRQYGFKFHPKVPTGTNPPPLLWLFAPFALLPPRIAFAGWAMGEGVSLMVILRLTHDQLRERLSARAWWLICAGVVSSRPVFWHFCFSQVQLLVGAAILLGLTAALKLLSLASPSKILALADPVFGVPYRWTILCGGLGELAIAVLLTCRLSEPLRLFALAWVGACFCGYHFALAVLDPAAPCPCLGTLTTQFGLSPSTAYLAALALGLFFLCAPVAVWVGGLARGTALKFAGAQPEPGSKTVAPSGEN